MIKSFSDRTHFSEDKQFDLLEFRASGISNQVSNIGKKDGISSKCFGTLIAYFSVLERPFQCNTKNLQAKKVLYKKRQI